jgi:diadenosine tetraphosphatase ApaH/serine/threonine PP2A family protein phosphatase
MREEWRISFGQILIRIETSLRYHNGMVHRPQFTYISNSCDRGAGYQFGAQIVEKFLHVNKMRHILRAHQLCNEGYQVCFSLCRAFGLMGWEGAI